MNPIFIKILKYVAIATVVYLIFRYVPNVKMNSSDILLISMITISSLLLLETLCSSMYPSSDSSEHMSSLEKSSMCNSVCSIKNTEHMADVIPTEEKPKNTDYEEILKKLEAELKAEKEKNSQNYQKVVKVLAESGIERGTTRAEAGTINNDWMYDRNNGHTLPLPDNYNKDDFEYGDSFLPPEKWYPQPPVPPVCVAEKKCPVCPVYTTGAPMDVKEWNDSRRVTQPDEINVKYVKDKLNSGR